MLIRNIEPHEIETVRRLLVANDWARVCKTQPCLPNWCADHKWHWLP
jgi:hypothetical protein